MCFLLLQKNSEVMGGPDKGPRRAGSGLRAGVLPTHGLEIKVIVRVKAMLLVMFSVKVRVRA